MWYCFHCNRSLHLTSLCLFCFFLLVTKQSRVVVMISKHLATCFCIFSAAVCRGKDLRPILWKSVTRKSATLSVQRQSKFSVRTCLVWSCVSLRNIIVCYSLPLALIVWQQEGHPAGAAQYVTGATKSPNRSPSCLSIQTPYSLLDKIISTKSAITHLTACSDPTY